MAVSTQLTWNSDLKHYLSVGDWNQILFSLGILSQIYSESYHRKFIFIYL